MQSQGWSSNCVLKTTLGFAGWLLIIGGGGDGVQSTGYSVQRVRYRAQGTAYTGVGHRRKGVLGYRGMGYRGRGRSERVNFQQVRSIISLQLSSSPLSKQLEIQQTNQILIFKLKCPNFESTVLWMCLTPCFPGFTTTSPGFCQVLKCCLGHIQILGRFDLKLQCLFAHN